MRMFANMVCMRPYYYVTDRVLNILRDPRKGEC